MFNIGVINIVKSGNRTAKLFEVRDAINKTIIDNEVEITGPVKVEINPNKPKVIITILGREVELRGFVFIEAEHIDNPNLKITTFIPGK